VIDVSYVSANICIMQLTGPNVINVTKKGHTIN